ncbi:major facilitator superfamily domain-containing protein [Phthorimaea operculella]|nr:major facilitator superfamily domain-containing protein [Phthorimaea operculella]
MVNHTKTSIIHVDPKACPSEDQLYNTTYNKTVDKPYAIFDWDEATQGFVLSGFYYGYAVSQLLGGVLSDRFGAKWVLGSGLFSTTVFTFLIPIVTRWGGSNYLFALRVIQGIGEGPCVPALMTIMSRWVPPNERSFQGALIFGGAHLDNVVGSSISGILLSDGKNWANVFYFFGFLALLWCLIWALLSYSTPSSHPFISEKELEYLNSEVKLNPKKNKANDPVPWKAILQSKPVWALVAAAVRCCTLSQLPLG